MSAPSITSIVPGSGTTIGRQLVSINGSNLQDVNEVSFGDKYATSVSAGSDLVTCYTPSSSTDITVDVTVTNTTLSWTNVYNYGTNWE